MTAIAYRAIRQDDLCRWANEEWRVMAIGPCGIVLHNEKHGARSMNWTQFQTGKGSHLFTTDALNSDNPGLVLGGYVSEANPPCEGDVVSWRGDSRRIARVIGSGPGAEVFSYHYGNQTMTVAELIDKRAYYAARCVSCTIPEDAEV